MILKRLAESIKKQDWFVVMLEVVIVVVGIFIGLQVDDWKTNQDNEALEREYIERLLLDTDSNIEAVKDQAESYLGRSRALQHIIESIDLNTIEQVPAKDLTYSFCYWYLPENIDLQSTTYDELIAIGGLELISDQNVRRQLQHAWATHRRVAGELPALGVFQSDLAKSLSPHIEWQLDAPKQTIDQTPTMNMIRAGCHVNIATLSSDNKIQSVLVQLHRSQGILAGLRSDELDALEKLSELLSKSISSGDSS